MLPIVANKSPKVLIIRILEACNAGCFMCSFRWSKDKYRYPHSEAITLAKTASESGIRIVRLTGGEPLLHEGVTDIISAFSVEGLLSSIITNGAFLERRCDELAGAGLAQVIVSLDGHGEEHDRFRKTPGLFKAAVAGVVRVKTTAPKIRIRVNTVVGPHNFSDLPKIYDLLGSIGVESWSLIPLKDEEGAWKYVDRKQVEEAQAHFVHYVRKNPSVRILGHGLHWIGRDPTEVDAFFAGQKVMTPRMPCQVVHQVRYYVPSEGAYFVCNCVPHRVDAMELAQEWGPKALTAEGLGEIGDWLHKNGPKYCRGCEPINAAFGEGIINIDDDPFGF